MPGSEPDVTAKELLSDQTDLVEAMHRLKNKFCATTQHWDKYLEEQLAKLFSLEFSEEDMQLLRGEVQALGGSNQHNNKKDLLIERLKEALTNSKITQEDVCNLLNNDLYEREKMAYQLANARDNRSNHRFNSKHLLVIR